MTRFTFMEFPIHCLQNVWLNTYSLLFHKIKPYDKLKRCNFEHLVQNKINKNEGFSNNVIFVDKISFHIPVNRHQWLGSQHNKLILCCGLAVSRQNRSRQKSIVPLQSWFHPLYGSRRAHSQNISSSLSAENVPQKLQEIRS